MAFDAHKNLAISTVAAAPSPATSGTTLTVAAGDNVIFPAAPFNATVTALGALPTLATSEIVRVTTKSGDLFTITRAQEGTTARAIAVGDLLAATITAKVLTDLETEVAAHGIWTAEPFNAAQYVGVSGTWTIGSAAVLVNRYTVIGKTLHWQLYLSWYSGSNTLAAGATAVKIKLPGGRAMGTPLITGALTVVEGAVAGTQYYLTAADSTTAQIQKTGAGGAFAAGALGVMALITVEIT